MRKMAIKYLDYNSMKMSFVCVRFFSQKLNEFRDKIRTQIKDNISKNFHIRFYT